MNFLNSKLKVFGFIFTNLLLINAALADNSHITLPQLNSAEFNRLNSFEKYFLTKERKYWNDVQDEGGLKGDFFGLNIQSVSIQGDLLFINSGDTPATIRKWASSVCGTDENNWDIKRNGSFTSGEAQGSLCKVTYQPFNDRLWLLTLPFIDKVALSQLASAAPAASDPTPQAASSGSQITIPTRESGNYDKYCAAEWTKLGKLDQQMFDYCVKQENEGYKELVSNVSKYSDQLWLAEVLDRTIKDWSKNGYRQDRMVSYNVKREIEAWQEIEYLKKQNTVDLSKLKRCDQGSEFTQTLFCYKNL